MGLSYNSENPDESYTFSLVHECEAVLPLEIEIPYLRVALTTEMTNVEKHRL